MNEGWSETNMAVREEIHDKTEFRNQHHSPTYGTHFHKAVLLTEEENCGIIATPFAL